MAIRESLTVPSERNAPPNCPSCERPTVPTRRMVLEASVDDIPLECMTPGCPDFGRRWTLSDLTRGDGEVTARPSWDDQHMEIARITSRRATCDRSHVGCVLVVNNRIVSSGYNGSFAGADHCDDVGHHMVDGRCTRTVHAEMNAIADAARRGVSVEGATAYITRLPCAMCLKLLIASGVVRVVCDTVIKPQYIQEAEWLARTGGVTLEYPEPE